MDSPKRGWARRFPTGLPMNGAALRCPRLPVGIPRALRHRHCPRTSRTAALRTPPSTFGCVAIVVRHGGNGVFRLKHRAPAKHEVKHEPPRTNRRGQNARRAGRMPGPRLYRGVRLCTRVVGSMTRLLLYLSRGIILSGAVGAAWLAASEPLSFGRLPQAAPSLSQQAAKPVSRLGPNGLQSTIAGETL